MKTKNTYQILWLALSSLLLFTACTTSSVNNVNLKLTDNYHDKTLYLVQFTPAEKRYAANDSKNRGEVGKAIDSEYGLYTYHFDDEDYQNLKQSIMQSLTGKHGFKQVIDKTHETQPWHPEKDSLFLTIAFTESGMKEGFTITAHLKAHAELSDQYSLLNKRYIVADGNSYATVASSKNAAIEHFITKLKDVFPK